MEGGVMQARAQRDIRPFDASVDHLRNYFRLLTTEGTARPAPRQGRGSIPNHPSR
jgi:hypothetical protein